MDTTNSSWRPWRRYGMPKDSTYDNNCLFHFFRSSSSPFSSQCLILFIKSSRSCILLLLLPISFCSVICLSMSSWRRRLLLKIWPIKLALVPRILFVCPLFSYMFKNVFITYFFLTIVSSVLSSSSVFKCSPNTSSPISLRGDCKPYPHFVTLVNLQEHFYQKLINTEQWNFT